MAHWSSPSKTMEALISRLTIDHPGLTFLLSKDFYWSAKSQTVYYAHNGLSSDTWSLLHEASHALLNHNSFHSDFQLLTMEMEAWEKAKELAAHYEITIDTDHIEDCLDTYRDWLHKRSLCPNCAIKSLQTSPNQYKCLNCATSWQVSKTQKCRPYRRLQTKTTA